MDGHIASTPEVMAMKAEILAKAYQTSALVEHSVATPVAIRVPTIGKNARLAAAVHLPVNEKTNAGEKSYDVLLMAYANDPASVNSKVTFRLWCGNPHLAGHGPLPADTAKILVDGQRYPEAGRSVIEEALKSSYNMVPETSRAACPGGLLSGMTSTCNHTAFAARALLEGTSGPAGAIYQRTNTSDLTGLSQFLADVVKEDLKKIHEGQSLRPVLESLSTSAPVMPDPTTMNERDRMVRDMLAAEQDFSGRGAFSREVVRLVSVANFKPARVLVVGPAGVGKSNTMRSLGNDTRIFPGGYHELQLMPDTDPKDIIGGFYPTVDPTTKQKGYEYVSGPLIAAMQSAQTQRTMLNLEEIGNAPHLVKVFKGLFNPHDGKYTLTIDKPEAKSDGAFGLTTVSCPVENLVVVGSANAGEGYNLDLGDRAVRDRFVIMRYGIDRELLMQAKDGDKRAEGMLKEFRSDASKAINSILKPGDPRFHDAQFCEWARPRVEKIFDGFLDAVRSDRMESPLSVRAIAEASQTTRRNNREDFVANLKLYGKNSARMLPDGTEMTEQVRNVDLIVDNFVK